MDEQARCSTRALWHVLHPPRSWRAIRLHRHVWATFYYSRMKAIYPSQAHRLQYTWCQVAMAASHGTTLGGLRTDILGSPPGPRPAHLLPVLQAIAICMPYKRRLSLLSSPSHQTPISQRAPKSNYPSLYSELRLVVPFFAMINTSKPLGLRASSMKKRVVAKLATTFKVKPRFSSNQSPDDVADSLEACSFDSRGRISEGTLLLLMWRGHPLTPAITSHPECEGRLYADHRDGQHRPATTYGQCPGPRAHHRRRFLCGGRPIHHYRNPRFCHR